MDGLDDLVITHSQGMLQLLARGDRGFDRDERVDYYFPISSHAVLDVNGDGIKDIVLHRASSASTLTYIARKPDGGLGDLATFRTLDSSYPNSDMAVGDLNSDGLPDLAFVGNLWDGDLRMSSMEVFENQGAAAFHAVPKQSYPIGAIVGHARVADVTGDGRKDLVLTANVGAAILVHQQQADGSLSAYRAYGAYAAPKSFAVEDMDGDGFNDLVVNNVGEYTFESGYNGFPGVSTYFQRSGILAFDSQVTGTANNGNEEPEALAVADFDANGCKDVLLAASGAYYRLNAHGCIVPPAADAAVSVEALDWRTIVTVRNKPLSAVAASGILRVHFVTRTGNFAFQYAPAGCTRTSPVTRTVTFRCQVSGLPPAQSMDFQFNYSSKSALDEQLRIYAAMDADRFDPDVSDNRSAGSISTWMRATARLPVKPLAAPKAKAVPKGGRPSAERKKY
jgi:hypothetical protein